MEAFLELFRECPDVKDKFMSFRNYSVADLERKDNGKGELKRTLGFQISM